MAVSSQKFQAPKGTRDFYPADLAVRRHIENVWRQVSINNGFEEIDGPTFEHLELYTHKSGPGIASELFQVMSGKDEEQIAAIRAGGAAPFALRPEFTPTLARMVAAKAAELPRPIKWFAIPSHFRAERPQRGRLREFMQWNVDFIGGDVERQAEDVLAETTGMFVSQADIEVLQVVIAAVQGLGLSPTEVRIKLGHRQGARGRLLGFGRDIDQIEDDLVLLDQRSKLTKAEYRQLAEGRKWTDTLIDFFDPARREIVRLDADINSIPISKQERELAWQNKTTPGALQYEIERAGVAEWCEFDSMIIRGLAYYTGLIFEAHEATGAERAIAGGGRYDNLIESFGGPKLAACGFGMGDVVLANILKDKGLLKPAEEYLPRPDAFVIAADDDAAAKLPAIVASLRKESLHVRQSYKTTRNVGKLLADASKCRARYAVILGKKFAAPEQIVELKDMDGGEQREVTLDELAAALRQQP